MRITKNQPKCPPLSGNIFDLLKMEKKNIYMLFILDAHI